MDKKRLFLSSEVDQSLYDQVTKYAQKVDRSIAWIVRQAVMSYCCPNWKQEFENEYGITATKTPSRIVVEDGDAAIEYGNDDDQNTNVEIEYDPDTDESTITETPA